MTTLIHGSVQTSTFASGSLPRCDGWPHCGCPNEATNDILGYKLCEDCARAYVAPDQLAAYASNHSPFTLAFEQSERELGEALGYPALVYQDTPDTSIIGTAADYDQAEMLDYEQRRNTQLEEECGALREALDQAHQHVGALVAACDEAHQVLWHYDLVRQPNGVDWEPVEQLQSRLIAQLGASHDAARAWLRRGAR